VLYSQGHVNWVLEKFNALLQSQAFTDLQYQYIFIDRKSGQWALGSGSYPSITQNAYLMEMTELLKKKKASTLGSKDGSRSLRLALAKACLDW
jgi:hypothetical protein